MFTLLSVSSSKVLVKTVNSANWALVLGDRGLLYKILDNVTIAYPDLCYKKFKLSLAGRLRNFPGGTSGKEPACNSGDLGSISGGDDPLEKDMTTHSSILA